MLKSLVEEGGTRRVVTCEFLRKGGRKAISEIRQKVPKPDVDGCGSQHTVNLGSWLMFKVGVCMCCVFQCGSVQMDVFCIYCLLWKKLYIAKSAIHVMLKLYPNISNGLERICSFKTSNIAELTVVLPLYFYIRTLRPGQAK